MKIINQNQKEEVTNEIQLATEFQNATYVIDKNSLWEDWNTLISIWGNNQ